MGLSLRGREVSLIKGAENRLLLKKLHTRVTRMNKVPKALDAIETVIKEVVKILVAVGKW